MVTEISQNQFKTEVVDHQGVVMVDFYADWCGPCQVAAPIIEAVSNEITSVKFIKVNVDNNSELASQYSVFSIPTLLIFKNGQVVNQLVGVQTREALIRELNKVVGAK